MNATCLSLTPQLIKVIDNFTDEYQEFREDAANIFAGKIIPGKSDRATALNALMDEAINLQSRLLIAYSMVVGVGAEKIGARHLIIPTKRVTGHLFTKRSFLVAPSPFDKVTITIRKTGGKAGVDIAICAKYSNGIDFIKKMKFIEKGKETIGEEARFEFTNMAGKVLSIHMVQTGNESNVCNYALSIEGEFNHQHMKTLEKLKQRVSAVRSSAL